jgi:hypothetical protein
MLEQAVIDAQALKEAAIKNAEQEILEKYSKEIKGAVDSLLEQEGELEEPVFGATDDMGFEGAGEEPDEIVNQLSMKALDGEKKTSSLSEDEVIELDLDALQEAIKSDSESQENTVFEASEFDLEELLEGGGLETCYDESNCPDIGAEEEFELDEESLKNAIEEILTVDLKNVPRGMLGTTHPTEIEQKYAVDIALAAEQNTDKKEEEEELNKQLRKLVELEEQVKSLKSDKNRLLKEHNDLKSIARQVSDKLTELNITNAKLVYQNRILESHSLNERQKEKLVEAVSNANSTKEAKVIYETLQDSLSLKVQEAPKNLNEAVSKNNRLVLKSNRKETQVSNTAISRMKKLAGII